MSGVQLVFALPSVSQPFSCVMGFPPPPFVRTGKKVGAVGAKRQQRPDKLQVTQQNLSSEVSPHFLDSLFHCFIIYLENLSDEKEFPLSVSNL